MCRASDEPDLLMQECRINLHSGAHGARKLADGIVSGVHQRPKAEAGPSVLNIMDAFTGQCTNKVS
jgi:hypothetical protein